MPIRSSDLDRYPIADIDDASARALVDACRRDLDELALCTLPGFIRPEVLPALVAEAETLVPKAIRCEKLRTPYLWMCNKGFPPGHPRSQVFRNHHGLLTADQFPGDGPIECMFRWDPLTDFRPRGPWAARPFYRSACPHLSLNLHIEGKGDELGWHFDGNDGVVSLLLQQPDEGGHFEYAPYLRAEDDEAYPRVARLFAGEPGIARRPVMAPGHLRALQGPAFVPPGDAGGSHRPAAADRDLQLRRNAPAWSSPRPACAT